MMPASRPAVRTMAGSARKSEFNKLGYGALALYAGLLVAMAFGIYGANVTGAKRDQSERTRAEVRTGRMLMMNADRSRCRAIRFDNETSELSGETLTDCDSGNRADTRGSFSGFRDSFVNRQ
jgi:hypothetical protein